MKNRVLLVDGDIIAYKAAASVERPVNWGGGLWTLHAYEHEAIAIVDQYHEKLMAQLEADHAVYALTDSERNWRLDILPTYKSNRKDTRKPMLLPFLREYLMDNYEAYLRPRLEGDDILGILSTHPHLVKAQQKIIVSLDKDMKTIPGWIFNDAKDKEPRLVSQEEADRYHLYQTLIGDTTDGYSGCPGVGPTAAEQILNDPRRLVEVEHTITRGKRKGQTEIRWVDDGPAESAWEAVVCQYHKAGLTEEDALIQARVARILRADEYDYKAKEVRPWNP